MEKELNIPIINMLMCLSDAIHLINKHVNEHHYRTTYIALSLADNLKLHIEQKKKLILASMMHDIGILSNEEEIKAFIYADENREATHAYRGYSLMKKFPLFHDIAPLVQYHHLDWNDGNYPQDISPEDMLLSNLISVADRLDAYIQKDKDILSQNQDILERIENQKGTRFMPLVVGALQCEGTKESFWLELEVPRINRTIAYKAKFINVNLDVDGILDLSLLFSQIIDFRSRFTSTHSSGVAATAEALFRMLGMTEKACQHMRIAGYLHDIGKLAVPNHILEKPGALTKEEFNLIRKHTFFTYKILENIEPLKEINHWASNHHERLNGGGYPFKYNGDQLCQGSRVMAVADIFTAITEDRPYRKGMSPQKSMSVIENMTNEGILDEVIVKLLKNNFDKINSIRIEAQEKALQDYQDFENSISVIM